MLRDHVDQCAMRGRSAQWRLAVSVLREPRDLSHILLIQGPPGSGKSLFLRNLATSAVAQGLACLDLRPGGNGRPGENLRLLGDPLGAALRQVQQVLDHDPEEPLLALLDEPSWPDPDWIHRLVGPMPVVWAITQWAGADPIPADAMALPAGRVTTIELPPLADDDAIELVTDLLQARPCGALVDLVSAAHGIPGALVDLVSGLREDGMLRIADGRAAIVRCGLPRRFHQSVRRRLSAISPRSRQALQVAATLGLTFSLLELADLSQTSVASLMPAIEEAVIGGLVMCCQSDRLSFCSELTRRAVVETIPSSVREALHTDVHRIREGAAAAPALSTLDRPQAPADPNLARVAEHLAAGRLHAAISQAREALAAQPPAAPIAAELQCLLAEALIYTGDAHQVMAVASPLIDDPELPAALRERAHASRLFALSLSDPARTYVEAQEILRDRPRQSGVSCTVVAATVLSNICWENGEMARGLQLAREGVSHISATTPVSWRPHIRLSLARKLADCRLLDEATALIDQTQAEVDEFGARVHSASTHLARARLHARAGRMAESQAEATTTLALSREIGSELLVPLASAALATAALRNGDLLTAADHVERFRGMFAAGTLPLWSAQYPWVEVQLVYEQEGPRSAARLLAERHEQIVSRRLLFIEEPGAAAWLVRLARQTGGAQVAEAVIAAASELVSSNPDFPALRTGLVHAQALMAGDLAALQRAVHEHADRWAAAWAEEDLGRLLMPNCSAVSNAIMHLESALRGFEAIGAHRDAARIRKRLRELGVRRRRSSSPVPAGAGSGWKGLSEIERTITHLVQLGLTNRQIASRVFLSPHTVNYHLRQIYKRLGITSRVQLAQVAVRQLRPDSGVEPGD